MVAYNTKGSGTAVEEQATAYLYTSPINASRQTGVVYPDSADGHEIESLSRSSGVATAVVEDHGFTTGQWVYVLGADQAQYNGRVQITVVDADTFTYSIDSTEPASASGMIRVYDPGIS
jgi:hypothetical protein